MIRDTKATQRSKWQHKRVKNNEVNTLRVNQRFEDGTQGENQKVKIFPPCLKINRFHWFLKIK
jgi:hypothetical protein